MKIAFFTEGSYRGKISRNEQNCRTELAWMVALDAEHIPLLDETFTYDGRDFDLGIVILPKKNIHILMDRPNIMDNIKKNCKQVAYMQEGPNWYWQDYPMAEQIWYYNTLTEADFLLCHNRSDVNYYLGLTGKATYVLPSLMIEDTVADLPTLNRRDVMIGGNMTSWYGGFDSMVVATEFTFTSTRPTTIFAPSMGRRIQREDELGITHIPYLNWTAWIETLNQIKYGVHLMRTHAAGTFALNCAYLGIPCIGYKGLDTQELCHPDLTVGVGDLESARRLASRLLTDSIFYENCSITAKNNYKDFYSEDVFRSNFYDNIIKK